MQGVVEYDMQGIRGPLINMFVILINALFFNIKLIGLHDIYPKDYSDFLLQEYEDVFDFIIVGAGTAGCSLANRLTENEKWSVLLIEAGDYPSITTEVPGLSSTLIGTKEDWYFHLEKDNKACNAYLIERCVISKGKVLGGTSSINNMLYMRGQTEDYDSQAFDSWGSNISYAILERMENFQGDAHLNVQHGSDGLIKLSLRNDTSRIKDFLINAYKEVGLLPLSVRHSLGYGSFLTMIIGGERKNMAKNFLTPIKDRPNLFFAKDTEAEAIGVTELLDKRANGVNVSIRGKRLFIKARKEVILSAGAINNAKLLLLSGLGPQEYLQEKKIPVVANLPGVGKNLQFHLVVPMFVAYQPEGSTCNRDYYTETEVIKDTYDYVIHRTGGFSHTGINNFLVYLSTLESGISLPNIAVHHMYFQIDDRNLGPWLEVKNFNPKIKTKLLKINREKAIILFSVHLVSPASKGQLYLNDTHYISNPKIIANFMSDDDNMDYETLLSGFDFITNMTDYMKTEAEFIDLDIPNCRNFKFCTPSYVKCYIHNMATPNSDVVGSTMMGADCQQSAVVKENLEVRTVRCLRVADSSVLNNMPAGNTIALDAMIGFKMGEILKEKWEKNYKSQYIPEQHNVPV